MKTTTIGYTWHRKGDTLLLWETGQTWDISHWTDEDFLDFLEQDNQVCSVEMLTEKQIEREKGNNTGNNKRE